MILIKLTLKTSIKVWDAFKLKRKRQQNNIELIASENVVSKAVMAVKVLFDQ